ncbi:hypothetical protein C8Q76DRAFT_802494 [Earliella scabrosa]|nr:hypothetical protein C8Q76DRAFT_802494 [Earliella scabrosa]
MSIIAMSTRANSESPLQQLPLDTILATAADLAAHVPRPDLPHIVNTVIHSCYQLPAFLDLPPLQRQMVLDWVAQRVMDAAFRIRREQQCAQAARSDPWCAPDGSIIYGTTEDDMEGLPELVKDE